MKEIWKDITGYEGYYQISNLGRLKSCARVTVKKNGVKLPMKEKILKPYDDGKGYLKIDLHTKARNTRKIHRLVAQAFIPNPLNLPQVNHKNGIKSDNRVSNLEWCNNSENIKHAFHTGLNKGKKGEQNPASKLSFEKSSEIRKLYIPRHKEYGASALARRYNVNKSTILDIIHNRSYKE